VVQIGQIFRCSDVPTSSSGSDQISSARQFRYKPEKPKNPESLKA